ncbi:MAG: glycosyltransferase family 2 protein [Bacteroidetes bacterium]|nr:glycosyltransferase family 2 protein [Bacteroidota bacterium]MBS1974828.1 glycosyltransferase family 2 protein [Bacteroidota bacterium]
MGAKKKDEIVKENVRKGITVILCCFNSEKRLPVTLEHLNRQAFSWHFDWEIIVVDNASTDKTAQAATDIWKSFKSSVPFKIVNEPAPGLSHARLRGVREANFSYIIFCDDDNWLNNNYLDLAFGIMEENSMVAVLGGQSVAAFETEPPAWFNQYSKAYAVGRQYEHSGDVTGRYEKLWGAGCIYRKEALDFLYENGFAHLLSDRTGTKVISGGDHELCMALHLAGYRLYYDDRLLFTHFMTAGRLRWEWYLNFQKNGSYFSILFDPYHKVVKIEKGLRGYLKETALYEIYISLLKLNKLKPTLTYFFLAPRPASETKHFEVLYEKYRILGLLNFFFSYRQLLYKVRRSAWLNVKGTS